jgi:hypothetical protein
MISLGILLPLIPLSILLSTKGLMFLLLSAYGGAMWTFLSGAPRVHTVIVSDLDRAKQFYEGILRLPEAELPLQYYYGGESGLMGAGLDMPYFAGDIVNPRRFDPPGSPPLTDIPGLWYQLSDNVQLHVVPGSTEAVNPTGYSPAYSAASYGASSYGSGGSGQYRPPQYGSRPSAAPPSSRYRHTSYDRDTVRALLKTVVKKRVSHSVRSQKPLAFWVRDAKGQIVEITEVIA